MASVDDITFRAVNPEYARMYGYAVEELMGPAAVDAMDGLDAG